MKSLIDTFRRIRRTYEKQSGRDRELICKVGRYGGSTVLKLQKASWTNDSMREVPNQTGIFFSIWIGKDGMARNRVKYDIHALKLRLLKGYKITSNDFAKEFRRRFRRLQLGWPNVGVDMGALTLMYGWVELDAKTLEKEMLGLMKQFQKVSGIIDELLVKRTRAAR